MLLHLAGAGTAGCGVARRRFSSPAQPAVAKRVEAVIRTAR